MVLVQIDRVTHSKLLKFVFLAKKKNPKATNDSVINQALDCLGEKK